MVDDIGGRSVEWNYENQIAGVEGWINIRKWEDLKQNYNDLHYKSTFIKQKVTVVGGIGICLISTMTCYTLALLRIIMPFKLSFWTCFFLRLK